MPGMSTRQKFRDHCQIIGIVQNKKPTSMQCQPVSDGGNHTFLILLIHPWQLQEFSQSHKVSNEGSLSSRLDPEYELVFSLIAVCILHRNLCLTDTSQTIDGLCLG